MGSKISQRDIDSMVELAKNGNAAAIAFLEETPHFVERGNRHMAVYKILKESGNERAGRLYDSLLESSRRKKARHKATRKALHSTGEAQTDEDGQSRRSTRDDVDTTEAVENAATTGEGNTEGATSKPDEQSECRVESTFSIKVEKPTLVSDTQCNMEQLPDAATDACGNREQDIDNMRPTAPVDDDNDLTVMSNTKSSSATLDSQRELITPRETPRGSATDSTASEYRLRKAKAEAGSVKESKKLEGLALMAKLRLPDCRDNRDEMRLKLNLVTTDMWYYKRRMEMVACKLAGSRRVEVLVAEARVRKAWYDAEVAFAELVLAFPGHKEMERPAAPKG